MPEGDKLAKRPRGHVITSLLQFERTSSSSNVRRRIELSNELPECYYSDLQMLCSVL